jgi:hypothetical protein
MASEGPPRAEEILCVRVPCRDGLERVWQAIKVLRQAQRHQQQRRAPRPVSQPETRARSRAEGS